MRPKPDITTLSKAADQAGLIQIEWARSAGISQTKLSLAMNGHRELSPEEFIACSNAVRVVLVKRIQEFNKFLKAI